MAYDDCWTPVRQFWTRNLLVSIFKAPSDFSGDPEADADRSEYKAEVSAHHGDFSNVMLAVAYADDDYAESADSARQFWHDTLFPLARRAIDRARDRLTTLRDIPLRQ